jgi:hypothetical protein
MPKVKLIPLVEEIHGTLDGWVFKKSPQGKMIITKKPDMSKVKWSKAQKDHRKRMAKAVDSVQAALTDPKVRAKYDRKAKRQGKRTWDLAMTDWFKGKDLYAKR